MMRFAVLVLALTLAACGTKPGQLPDLPTIRQTSPAPAAPPPKAEPIKEACAEFREWSAADLKILAGTLAAIPETSILVRVALDWRRYYGDARACNAKQHK